MVTQELWDDPDAQAWRQRANRELRPMIKDSSATCMLWNDEPDAKMAVELGFTLLLGRPLIILKPAGANIPERLARLADGIVEYDSLDSLEGPEIAERLHAELERIGVARS